MKRTIEGWLIKYNSFSKPFKLNNGRLVSEVFLSGAFADSVRALNAGEYEAEINVEHRMNDALMRLATTQYNAEISHRDDGVYIVIDILDDSVSNDIFVKTKNKIVKHFSIQFQLIPGIEPSYDAVGGNYIRKISAARLQGGSVVAKPAYDDALITKVTEDGAVVFARGAEISHEELELIEKEIGRVPSQYPCELYHTQRGVLVCHGARHVNPELRNYSAASANIAELLAFMHSRGIDAPIELPVESRALAAAGQEVGGKETLGGAMPWSGPEALFEQGVRP